MATRSAEEAELLQKNVPANALRDAVNLTPHSVIIFGPDQKTVLFTVEPEEGGALRLEQGEKREVFYLEVGDGVKVPCNAGPAVYAGMNREPPNKSVIVSELVARHLVEVGFAFSIFVPDTNPESVVRDGGRILGVTMVTLYNPGRGEV